MVVKTSILIFVVIILSVTIGVIISETAVGDKIKSLIGYESKEPVSSPATTSNPSSSSTSYLSNSPPDYARFEKELVANPMISSIPNGATIMLKTFNFNTGERTWEKAYTLTKGSVKGGEAAIADVTIVLSSKYVNSITNTNFCDVVKQSKTNGDLGIWTDLSTFQLTWKFKSMFGYRDCLGF